MSAALSLVVYSLASWSYGPNKQHSRHAIICRPSCNLLVQSSTPVFFLRVHSTPPPSHLNVSLKSYNWFAGKKDRPLAEQALTDKSDGTFLIRESVNRSGEYALSVKFRNNVKHIKIPYEEGAFYLTKAITFPSVEELVEYYKNNTLRVSFPGLDTKLRHGVNEEQKSKDGIGWAKALYPYAARNPKEISIQKNSKILILNQEGDWWRGECEGQVGYFPSNYVEVLKETIEPQD